MHMPSSKTSHTGEIIGIFVFLLGLLLGISLLTYHPNDPSLTTAANLNIQNYIGKTGAIISDILFQIIGVSAYFVPIILVLSGIRRLKKDQPPRSVRRLIGWGVLMTVLSSGAEFLAEEMTPPHFRGGTISLSLNLFLIDYLGRTGSALVLSFAFIWSWMLVAPFSPSGIAFSIIEKIGISFGWLLQQMKKRLSETRAVIAPKKEREEDDHPDDLEEMGEMVTQEETVEEFQPVYLYDNATETSETEGGYQLPPLSLLADPPVITTRGTPEEWAAQAKVLKRKLADFGVEGEVREIHPGPVVTMFEFEPAPGIKLSRITSLADDLALAMRALQVRIVSRVPGKPVVGIEIPNRVREGVFLREILASTSFTGIDSKTRIALGKDISGVPIAGNLAEMPHLLIAGTTGSGKSVGLNSIILSILFSAKPTEVKLLLIDPKMLELSLYEDIPHLFAPVITRPKVASGALKKMVEEMQRRYELMAMTGVRNIDAYNKFCAKTPAPTEGTEEATPPFLPLPYIIVFIDELADLMVVASKDVEDSIGRLAQMARAAGIHLVLATQRPSVDVLTGVIKANFSARIAYAVTSKTDSRTILDTNGAEQLLGKGDMLCLSAGTSRLLRIHGAYVSEEEVKRVVTFIKEQGKPCYETVFSTEESPTQKDDALDVRDELYDKSCELVLSTGQASASFIQRRLRMGYPRAARMIELMEEDGLIGPAVGSKPREILVKKDYKDHPGHHALPVSHTHEKP